MIGGEDWQIGDETTIQLSNADQPLVLSGLANGYIVAANQSVFDSSRIDYKNQLAQVDSLNTRQSNSRTAATNTKDSKISSAKTARNTAVQAIEDKYQQDLALLQVQQDVATAALLAAQRASKEPNNFPQAFSTAYKFEFNRTKLNEIADLPWTNVWTFKAINTLIKVTRLADQADSIASKYSYSAALKFNNALAGAFTNDPDFRSQLRYAQSFYSKATGLSIKI